MSVCFKSIDVSHNFSRTAAPVRNHMVCMNQTNLPFQQIKEVNDEEQLLRIFRSLHFEIKCNNNRKDSFDFFCQELFLPLKCININRIIELSCWAK